MAKRFRGNGGFTIIELLLTVTLFGYIIGLSATIFISTMKICGELDQKVELQQQGLFILSFLEDKIIEAEGINLLQDESKKDKIHTCESVKINKIIFRNNESHKKEGYVFNLTNKTVLGTCNLLYKTGLSGTGSVEIGNYIEFIEVEPLPSGTIFVDAAGIVIRINFLFEDNRICVEDAFCFRNKPEEL